MISYHVCLHFPPQTDEAGRQPEPLHALSLNLKDLYLLKDISQ